MDQFSVVKSEGIWIFLRALSQRAGEWRILDHWEGDLTAIGVIWKDHPERLAYISSWEQSDGSYFVELEKNAEDDAYEVVAQVERCDLDHALELIVEHLQRPRRSG